MFSYSSINKYNIQSEEFKFRSYGLFKPGIGRECFNVDGAG
jgi:hypothetical protein